MDGKARARLEQAGDEDGRSQEHKRTLDTGRESPVEEMF